MDIKQTQKYALHCSIFFKFIPCLWLLIWVLLKNWRRLLYFIVKKNRGSWKKFEKWWMKISLRSFFISSGWDCIDKIIGIIMLCPFLLEREEKTKVTELIWSYLIHLIWTISIGNYLKKIFYFSTCFGCHGDGLWNAIL